MRPCVFVCVGVRSCPFLFFVRTGAERNDDDDDEKQDGVERELSR